MKQFIFRGIGFFILASLFVAVAVNARISYRTNTDMEFTLTNVEALAQDENGGGGGFCADPGNITCDDGNKYGIKNTR